MGKLAVIKTKETDSSVDDFISSIKDEAKRKDSYTILKLMQKATKEKPKIGAVLLLALVIKFIKVL